MNKIFKVVWSKVRNCYVVVSEIAKNTVSGVGKRNRIGKVSLAATLAASVLTGGFFMPNEVWAAESALVDAQKYNYIAIEASNSTSSPFTSSTGVEVSRVVDGMVTIKFTKNTTNTDDDESYIYRYTEVNYTDENGNKETAKYWIRDGFGVKAVTERYHPKASEIRLDLYKIPGAKANYDYVAMTGEHSAEVTSKFTAVNHTNLDNLAYIQYAGMVNSQYTDVPKKYQYFIKRGEEYVNVGGNGMWDDGTLNKNFYVFKLEGENPEYNPLTGKYTFNGQDVDYDDVYKIGGKVGVFLTKSYTGAYDNTSLRSETVYASGARVYGGSVYGGHNEILLSGYDSKTDTWSTVWAGEITDPNATIQTMTLNEFNEILHHIHEEDVKLLDADIAKINITPNVDTGINSSVGAGTAITNGGSINLVNMAGKQVPGILVESIGGTNGEDRKITFTDAGSGTTINEDGSIVTTQDNASKNKLTLNVGSVVVANNGNYVNGTKNPLTSLKINGQEYFVTGVTTATGSGGVQVVDDDTTTIVTGSYDENTKLTTYRISAVDTKYTITGNKPAGSTTTTYTIEDSHGVKQYITDTDTDTKYDVVGGIPNSSNTTEYTITGTDNTVYTILDKNTVNTSVDLEYNSETNQLQVNVTDSNGTVESNVVTLATVTNGTGGNVSGNDKYLKPATTNNGKYTIDALNHELVLNVENGDDVTISDIATHTEVLSLETKVNAGWEAQINGEFVKKINAADNKLNFVEGENVDIIKDSYGGIVINAVDTKYTVTPGTNNIDTSTKGNAVNVWTFSEVGGTGTGTAIVDTDTYITDVSVNNNKLTVTQNGGTQSSFDVQFVAGDNVNLTTDSVNSEITISAKDTKVVSGNTNYGINGTAATGTVTLTNNDGTTSVVNGLKNTYINDITLSGNTLVFDYNDDGITDKRIDLSGLTSTLGTMSRWKAQVVGDEEISIANNEILTYEAGSNIVLDSNAANKKVTVALDNVVELKNNAQNPATTIKLDGTDGSVVANHVNVGNIVVDSQTNRISGLVAGEEDDDAVNFGQLKSYVAANDKDTITRLNEGENGSVTVTKDVNGNYTVSGVDTNTTYTVTSYDRESADASNVAKKWVIGSSDANQSDVTIVDTDTKVTGLQVTYDAAGNGTLLATTNGDAPISTSALHDYYAESLAVDGNKLQLTLNNNQVLEVELSDITAGLGTMSGWKAQVVSDEEISIANNETLTYEAGSNIVLDSNAANKKVTVALDNVVELKNNAQNPATTIKLDGTDGSVVANHVNVGSVVVDSQTNRISGLVAGVNDNDAVNVKQLKDYVASEEVIVDGEGSVTVTKTTENDKTKYIVTAVDTKVAASEAIYESNGVGNIALKNSVDNTTVNISGLRNYYTNGFVLDSSTDQLTITRNDGKNFVVDVTNLATDYKLISNPNDTEGYTVTAGGEINLVVQDSNNANNKDVITILDVAKQSVVNSSISTINTNISTINSSINNITDAVSQHTGQITTINNKLNEHSTSINTINTSISNLNDNDINRIKFVESNVDTGLDTIQLVRNDNSVVPGSLKIVAGGGRETSVVDANGNTVHTYPDTHIIVSSTYNGVESTITLNTGSVVSANDQFTSHDFEDLEFITINGKHYKMPSYDVSSGQLIPDRDYHLVNGGEDLLTHYDTDGNLVTDVDGYKVDEYGIVTMLVQNNHNPAVHQGEVSIGNIATKTQQDTNTAQLKGTVMYDYDATTQKYDYGNIRLGETGSNINGTATTDYQKNTDGTYSGGVKVTNVAYAETDSTKNGYVGSAAVNVDLLNDKISDVALEAAKATTVTGDSNINVTESNNANGSKNYAVALNSDITLSTKEQDSVIGKVEISSSTNTVAVGVDETKEVVVNGSTGTITAGQKVTIDGTDGDARFGAVNIDGTTGTINAGQNVSINGTTGIITAGQKVTIDGSDGDATFGAVSIDGTKGSVVAGSITVNDNNNGTINGLSNTEWGGSYTIVSGQAATEDQLQKAVEQMQSYVTSNDQHIDYNKEYKVVDDKITLDVANSGGKQVVINDVASATALSKEIAERKATDEALSQVNARQDGQIANLQFVNDRQDGQIANLQFVNDRQDEQIANLQFVNDRQDTQLSRLQEDVAQEVIDREANDIVSGKIDSDGTVTLTKGDTSTITVGKISNHMLDEIPVSVKEDGTVTLTATNAYDANDKKSVTISDVASKKVLDAEIAERIAYDQAILNYTDARANQLDSRINQLGSKVNKVGAGAAALAALHPMDFDPDDKLSFAVGAGNYAGENATALGAFYRPNEKVMMNVAGTYGNGENMVNMGVSFALDRTNNVSNSRTAMAKEIVDLREQVATQGQQIAQLVALVQQLAGTTQPIVPAEQLFPDVPQNHWAYEYVNGLIAKGIIEGYPDGTFGGDRAMTRYEFAAMLFRAMEQGVVINEQVRQEFEKELGRIRVDRVKGTDADLNKIERVRVNPAIDRDDYGSKVVQVKH